MFSTIDSGFDRNGALWFQNSLKAVCWFNPDLQDTKIIAYYIIAKTDPEDEDFTEDVTNLVYDPHNRTKEHNNSTIKQIRKNGGADSATLSNVLNVIKEPEIRLEVLNNIKSLLKPGANLYITVYEGTGKGDSGETKSG